MKKSDRTLDQSINKLEAELQKLKTKKKNVLRKEREHKKFVLGGVVAKHLGIDVNIDLLEDILTQAKEQLITENKKLIEDKWEDI